MSSDNYFDDELPSAVLYEFDVIDAAHRTTSTDASPGPAPPPTRTPKTKPKPCEVIPVDDSDDYGDFDDIVINDDALKAIDQACTDALAKDRQGRPVPTTASRRNTNTLTRTRSKATIQTTLDGTVLAQSSPSKKPVPSSSSRSPSKKSAPSSSSRSPLRRRTSSTAGGNVLRGKAKKTKEWDHTAFAKTGWKRPKNVKGKERAVGSFDDEEELEEDNVEFEQFPAPFVPIGPPPPMKLKIDRLAARHWIYPLNQQKRDYQYNIVKKCLFDNTLVALPTGLGKTLIAGVVMLNFYTWFPEGKVVFVAPTKPLVAQQIDACHKTCGIPGSHAAELTGQNSKHVRARAWQEKRVFYMTPQTLMNDLRTENCDPTDIVLLVIDEAHKGTGDYAYAQLIRFMMAKNPHFRVLALTATPGSKPEAVQVLVDALHISHIEIRDENSLDLKPYMHKKRVVQHIVKMNNDVVKVRDLLAAYMEPMIKKVAGAGLLPYNPNPIMLHSFTCLKAMNGAHGRGTSWAFGTLSKLSALSRAMGYLLENSISLCHSCLEELASAPPKGKQKENPYKSDSKFQAIVQELEAQKNRPGGFPSYPKMEKLKMLLIEHFTQKECDREDALMDGTGESMLDDSRVMVFSTFRQCVEEIVQYLNQDSPLIRAVPFIGQGSDKSGKKGYGQKEQLEVIKKFKAGQYNVLVSTSIGEEGLDIGEVDMIICYEAQKSAIRMLQRVGRTGRRRDGFVHVLMGEIREERNWDKANENYEDVQRFIIRAEDLELYGDVDRLVPAEFDPVPILQVMPIEEYVRDDGPPKRVPRSSQSKASKAKKRDPKRGIPTGASSGFVNASQLVLKGRLSPDVEIDSDALNSDSDDHEIMAGIHGPRRTISMPAGSAQSKRKKGLRRSATTAAGITKKVPRVPRKKREEVVEVTSSQLQDDSTDNEIAGGVSVKCRPSVKRASTTPRTPSPAHDQHRAVMSSPEIPLADGIIDLTTADDTEHAPPIEPAPSRPVELSPESRPAVLLEKYSSPSRSASLTPWFDHLSTTSSHSSPPEPPVQQQDPNMAWLLDDDESDTQIIGSSPLRGLANDEAIFRVSTLSSTDTSPPHMPITPCDTDLEVADERAPPSPIVEALPNHPLSIPNLFHPRQLNDMPPPPLPEHLATPATPRPSLPDPNSPELSSFVVRDPGKGKKRARIAVDSSPIEMSSHQRRLHRGRAQSPDSTEPEKPKRKKRKFRDIVEAQRHNPWMDVEASHSGDEHSVGGSEGDELVSESDRRFLEELPSTQASASYDQAAIYRRSLMTQAPGASMPAFARGPARRGAGYVLRTPSNLQDQVQFSSSPLRAQDSDDYMIGSFIVPDDDEIAYASDRSTPSDT